MPIIARRMIADTIFEQVEDVSLEDREQLRGWRFRLGRVSRPTGDLHDLLARAAVLAKLGEREGALLDTMAVHGRRFEGSHGHLINLTHALLMLGQFDTARDIAHEFLRAGVHEVEQAAISNAFYAGTLAGDLDLVRTYHDATQDHGVAEWLSALDAAGASAAFTAHQQIVHRLVRQSMCDFKVNLGDEGDGRPVLGIRLWLLDRFASRRKKMRELFDQVCIHYDHAGIRGDPLSPLLAVVFSGMPDQDESEEVAA